MGLIVTLLLALTMPVSQLRTVTIDVSCCCPDPESCHCPDGSDGNGDQPHLETCHKYTQVHVAPVLPAFTAPVAGALPAAPARATAVNHVLGAPHAPPPPPRPAAPS